MSKVTKEVTVDLSKVEVKLNELVQALSEAVNKVN